MRNKCFPRGKCFCGIEKFRASVLEGRIFSRDKCFLGENVFSGTMECFLTLLRFSGELLLAVVEKVCVEVLTTQVSVTSGGLDGEDTALDIEERHIESTTTQIVDEDVALLVGLVGAETVGDSSSGGLVDDTQDVEARDGTGVLGGLTLVVVEVGRDGDDGLLHLLAELDLSNLLHLFADRVSVFV